MTTWTRRTAPSSINWVKRLTIKKESNNFYTSFTGIINGLVPTKKTNNFYTLAGTAEATGLYLLGRAVSNFTEAVLR